MINLGLSLEFLIDSSARASQELDYELMEKCSNITATGGRADTLLLKENEAKLRLTRCKVWYLRK